MEKEVFYKSLEAATSPIMLQGEGEPMLHPLFWEFVFAARKIGLVTTTTNGTSLNSKNRELIVQNLARLYVSLDTLDQNYANSIGRFYTLKVVEKIKKFRKEAPNYPIVIRAVNLGQDLSNLISFCAEFNLGFTAQELNYTNNTPVKEVNCTYKGKFIDIAGQAYPCCFIKNNSNACATCRFNSVWVKG